MNDSLVLWTSVSPLVTGGTRSEPGEWSGCLGGAKAGGLWVWKKSVQAVLLVGLGSFALFFIRAYTSPLQF